MEGWLVLLLDSPSLQEEPTGTCRKSFVHQFQGQQRAKLLLETTPIYVKEALQTPVLTAKPAGREALGGDPPGLADGGACKAALKRNRSLDLEGERCPDGQVLCWLHTASVPP